MKYLLIVAAVALLVRIDWVIRVFDRSFNKSAPAQISSENEPSQENVPSSEMTITQNPRTLFFGFLKDFSSSPSEQIRGKLLEIMRANPTMFKEADQELANSLSELKAQMVQKNRIAASFLIELMGTLKGKNIDSVRQVFVTLMDEDVAEFIYVYKNTSDTNCGISLLSSNDLEGADRISEFQERLTAFEQFLASEKGDPQMKQLASNCRLQLRFTIEKLQNPAPVPESAPAPVTTPAPETAPAPVPTSPTQAPVGTSP